MEHSPYHSPSLRTLRPPKGDHPFQGVLQVTRQSYRIADTTVYCWLCRSAEDTDPDHPLRPPKALHAVYLYSAPCGLLRITAPTAEMAEDIFSLMVTYDVSPYHAEDVLEDRELPVTVQYL